MRKSLSNVRIVELAATAGTGALTVFTSDQKTLVSTSRTIDSVLRLAFDQRALLTIETFDGGGLIKRVEAFKVGDTAVQRKGGVSRVATQRQAVKGELLEVFLYESDIGDSDVQYQVFDAVIQTVCLEAASRGAVLVFTTGTGAEEKVILQASLSQ
jgi:hypothetical protein